MAKYIIGSLALVALVSACTGGSDDASAAGNAEVSVVSAGAGGASTASTDESTTAPSTAGTDEATTAPTTAAPTTGAPTTTVAPTTTAAPTTAAPTTVEGTIIRSESANFISPSGNIACSLSATSGASCYIMEKQWTIDAPAGCEDDFGNGLAVTGGGAFYSCYTDFAWDFGAAPLAYGDAVATGEFICESAESGVTCSNGAGRGFKVARARGELF